MAKEERDKRRKRRKRFRISLISFILIYLVFRSVPALYASNLKTTLVEEGNMEDAVKLKGVIVKKEKVYKSDGEGKISILKNQGERVRVGAKIAQVSLGSDESNLKSELEKVNEKIKSVEKVNKGKESLKLDEDKASKNIDTILEEIQNTISSENYSEVHELKDDLYYSLGKKSDANGENTLASQSLDNLKKKKEEFLKEISDNTITYSSQEAGIVSFKVDGLEEIYTSDNIDKYTLDDVRKAQENIKKINNNDKVSTGEYIFKIIDNYNWYLLVDFDDIKKISPLKEGDWVQVCLDDNKDRIKGKVVKIKSDDGQALMIIKFDTCFDECCEKRNVDVYLIKSSYNGLKVPIKAICEKDDVSGVYIKDISGIIKFRPVKILCQNDDYAIVSYGNKNNYINIKGSDNKVKTIKLFDEILLNGGRFKEGRIVD